MIEVNDLVRFSNEALRLIVVRGGKHRLMRGKQKISRVIRILSNSYRGNGEWQRIVELDYLDIHGQYLRISVEWLVLYKKGKKDQVVDPFDIFDHNPCRSVSWYAPAVLATHGNYRIGVDYETDRGDRIDPFDIFDSNPCRTL